MLRLAGPEDAGLVADIMRAAFSPIRGMYDGGGYEATVLDERRIAARLDEGPTWIIDDDATVAAIERTDGLLVRSMAVRPDARGRGLGQRLMEVVEEYAKDVAAPRMVLSTTPFLHAAIRLYERNGFVRTDEPPYDWSGTPIFTMEKRL